MSHKNDLQNVRTLYVAMGNVDISVHPIVDIGAKDDPCDYGCQSKKKTDKCEIYSHSSDMLYEIIQFGIIDDIHLYVFECPHCHCLYGLRQRVEG